MAINWSGIASGASAGSGIGAAGGPWGWLAGLLGGGLAGAFLPEGSAGGVQQISNLTPEQQQYLPQLLQMAMQQYQNPYQEWGGIEDNAWRNFNGSIIPQIQERYNTGADHYSSGPGQRALYGAAGDLQSRLASARAQYGQQNRQNSLQTLLNPNYVNNVNRPGQQGFGEAFLPYAAKIGAGGLSGLSDYQSQMGTEGFNGNRGSMVLKGIANAFGSAI